MNSKWGGTTREWLVVAIFTLVGAILRFWAFGRLSLSHFDEGIYAFSGLWSLSRNGLADLDPSIIAYAPPGFPLMVGIVYGVFGVSDHAAIFGATLAGSAAIPVVAWLGRRTFGPGAAPAAATFAALAMAHVAFSRKALTDAPFLLAWLVAMGAAGRFLEQPGFSRSLALGAAVGVAQSFKYNGWLAGVIVGVAALAGALVHREDRRRGPLLRTFGWGLFAAGTACTIYAPWYRFVESHGGYTALLRHHRGYLNAAAWFPHWRTQLGEAYALSGPWYVGALTGLLAWLSFEVASQGGLAGGPWRIRLQSRWFVRLALIVVGCSLQAYFIWWLALGLAPWLLWSQRPAARLLGAWWLIMAVLTPFYHPYARLWLPLHAAGWLMLAGLVSIPGPPRTRGVEESEHVPGYSWRGSRRRILLEVAFAGGLCAAIQVTISRPFSMPWSSVLEPPEPSLRRFAFETVPQVIPQLRTTVCVYAVRPLAFYLVQLGRYTIQLEPASTRLLEGGGPPGSWALIERAMLRKGGYHEGIDYPWSLVTRRYHSKHLFIVDPVTLLDAQPDAAFFSHPGNVGVIYVWSPTIPAQNTDMDNGPQPTERAHEP
jgi:4-amino-4-deoxy-L-arabinose transferase-like glycosyltransferase